MRLLPSRRRVRQLEPAPDGELLYAIGDVHGRLDLLDELLADIRIDMAKAGKPSRIVLLGDLIDRGPSSRQVVARALELRGEMGKGFVCLKGNHEAMLLTFLEDPSAGPAWAAAGGYETLRSYLGSFDKPRTSDDWARLSVRFGDAVAGDHRAYLDESPLMVIWGPYVLVHAGVRPGVPLEDQVEEDLLWIRKPFLHFRGSQSFLVVHGHTPSPGRPSVSEARIGIDTGAYATGVLTALRLEGDDRRFLQTGSLGAPLAVRRSTPAALH